MTHPDIIIVLNPGPLAKYVIGQKIDMLNRRRAILNTDIEKAMRFWSTTDAHNYITHFVADGKKYKLEKFAPAAQLNQTQTS